MKSTLSITKIGKEEKEEEKIYEESPFDLDDARSRNQTIAPLEVVPSTDHSTLGRLNLILVGL